MQVSMIRLDADRRLLRGILPKVVTLPIVYWTQAAIGYTL